MDFKPRWYQQEAFDATDEYLSVEKNNNPCILLPTGSGKSAVMAMFCKNYIERWPKIKIMIIAHIKELVEQNAKAVNALCPDIDIGIYSAMAKRRDLGHSVISASIQSVYKKPELFAGTHLLLIDEVHHIQPAQDEGTYRKFIKGLKSHNKNLKIIGFTATAFRTKEGLIFGPKKDGYIFNEISYEIKGGVKTLIEQGYLCKLTNKQKKSPDTSNVGVLSGDFKSNEIDDLYSDPLLVRDTVKDICQAGKQRKKWLLYACGLKHQSMVLNHLRQQGISSALIHGQMDKDERELTLLDFHEGRYQALVAHRQILTEGYDEKSIDLIGIVFPTLSRGLFEQVVGRGLRIDNSKEDTLILDYGNNLVRHGPIDEQNIDWRKLPKVTKDTAPFKTCKGCNAPVPISSFTCKVCGYEFPPKPPEQKLNGSYDSSSRLISSNDDIVEIDDIYYEIHNTKIGAPSSVKVSYFCFGTQRPVATEWLCFEHEGYVRSIAEKWFIKRTGWNRSDIPHDAQECLDLLIGWKLAGTLPEPKKIKVKKEKVGDRTFKKVAQYIELPERPKIPLEPEELTPSRELIPF